MEAQIGSSKMSALVGEANLALPRREQRGRRAGRTRVSAHAASSAFLHFPFARDA